MQKTFKLLEFNVYDEDKEVEEDEKVNIYQDNKEFIVQMFGLNEEGKTLSLIARGFKPFFYIKVNDDWTETIKNKFLTHLKNYMGNYYKDSLISGKFIERKKLDGFDAEKYHKFICLKFKSTGAFNKAKKLWYTDNYVKGKFISRTLNQEGYIFQIDDDRSDNLYIYESNIPTLLRLFHIKEISPSGWIALPTKKCIKIKNKKTTCDYEYSIDYKFIIPLPEKETIVPYKMLSFDIEASSSHGDFPLAKKDYRKLATDIVDLWNKEDSLKNENGLKRMILTAFNYDNLCDINEVYPKKSISKSELEIKFKEWINLKPAKESFNEIINEIIEESSEDEEEDEEKDENYEYKKFNKKQYIKNYTNKEGTILDLMNDTCSRDTKIKELTKTLSKKNLLPQLEGDQVTFIGSTFKKFGEKEEYLNHCIVLRGCEIPDNVKYCEIETYNTEKEVLLAWTNLINRENPDIIIGYNITGFDEDFMDKRAQELDCRNEFLQLSRNINEVCVKKDWKTNREDIETNKIVLASGEYELRYINMNGRLKIDLLNYLRREFQLSCYKLDYISGYFIGDQIIKTECDNNRTKIYSKNLKGLEIGSYVAIQEVNFSINPYKNGKKFEIININLDENYFEIMGNEELDNKKKFTWGLAKDDVGPQEIFKLANGSDKDRAKIAKYCLKDCKNTLDVLEKIDVITFYVEMAGLCNVPKSFLVNRGQGIKLQSYIAKKCREKQVLMPVLEKSKDDEGYEGAIVLEPKCDIYLDDPVACVDYSSLYPSSMISENLSHDSKVWTKEFDLDGNLLKEIGEKNENGEFIYDNLPEYKYVDVTFDLFKWERKTAKAAATKVKVGYKICRFAQFPNGSKAVLPSILEELLQARKSTRKLIPLQKDDFMKNILDKRQLSIKVTANSLYGQTGAKTSSFFEKDVAASTTAIGRTLLLYGKKVIEEYYKNRLVILKDGTKVFTNAEIVYGDTDSVFFKFNLKREDKITPIIGKEALKITIELAQDAGNLATKFLKKPHDLEYEKTFLPFCLLSKKRYVGMLHEFDPDKGKLKSMGLVLKRRDNADIVKDIYGETINILMKGGSVTSAIEYVKNCMNNIIEGKYPLEKLIITKSLRSHYKNPNQIAHKVLSDRIGERETGNKPKPGDRIQFAFFKNENKKCLQGEKIETPYFIKKNNLTIDYAHYITNQIMKPLQQLFALVLEQIKEFKQHNLGHTYRDWNNQMKKLSEKWTDPDKLAKKIEEARCKEIKKLIFDEYINKVK
jgi:DNA polymerase elongation subunit (family B)